MGTTFYDLGKSTPSQIQLLHLQSVFVFHPPMLQDARVVEAVGHPGFTTLDYPVGKLFKITHTTSKQV